MAAVDDARVNEGTTPERRPAKTRAKGVSLTWRDVPLGATGWVRTRPPPATQARS